LSLVDDKAQDVDWTQQVASHSPQVIYITKCFPALALIPYEHGQFGQRKKAGESFSPTFPLEKVGALRSGSFRLRCGRAAYFESRAVPAKETRAARWTKHLQRFRAPTFTN
jgi:hypothetical protein